MIAFALLWLIILAACLLATALATSLAARCQRPLWQKFWPIVLSVLIFLKLGGFSFLAGIFLFQDFSLSEESSFGGWQSKWVLWYWLALTAAFLAGALTIMIPGLKRTFSRRPAALSWPVKKIALAFVLSLIAAPALIWFMADRFTGELLMIHKDSTDKLVAMMRTCPAGAENSVPEYQKAFDLLNADKEKPAWFSDAREDVSRQDLEALVTRHERTLALARRAASLACWEILGDPSRDVLEWPVPKFQDYRNLVYLLFHSARAKVLANDTAGALRELGFIERQANQHRNHPFLISQMMGVAEDAIRIRGLEFVLANAARPVTGSITLPVKVQTANLDGFRRAHYAESLTILQAFSRLGLRDAGYFAGFTMDSDIPWPAKLIDATKIPFIFLLPADIDTAKSSCRLMEQPVKSYKDYEGLLVADNRMRLEQGGLFTRLATPQYSGYLARGLALDARRGLADLALAATAYKEAKGRYPDKLEDLVPDYIDRVPVDPFDEKPLKVKSVDGGIDLYSVSASPTSPDLKSDPIHFYLGREAYNELRVKPETEARLKKEKQERERGGAKKTPGVKQ